MSSRALSPHYIDLVYSAGLASFWRRRALHKFLRNCGIAESFLATWHKDETKRDLLDRLFERLHASEHGSAVMRRMGKALAEQKTYPDLENWEDSAEKIHTARDAVDALRRYQDDEAERKKQEQSREEARKRYQEQQEKVRRSQVDFAKLTARLAELTGRIGTQKAGYDFQDWFFDLLEFFDIECRRPYVHDRRQIDGSVTHDGTTYLVELKFTSQQAGAPDIDTFHKKVVGKADNTMGIMLSMSGFSSVAIKEASGPRTPLLLIDHSHVYAVLSGIIDLRSLIDRVRRHASQTGEAFLPVNRFGG